MNEVFELPVSGIEMQNHVAFRTFDEEDDAIAHAINNVDALADALEALLPHVESNRELGKSGESAHVVAQIALNAYRGVK